MKELALHLMDIAENSVSAEARSIEISISENLPADRLLLRVRDDGRGMDAETAARAVDPFHTSRTTRKVGLGLPLLKFAAQSCNGDLFLETKTGEGTCVQVSFQRSHIDRMPLGDLPGTFLTLLVAHPEVDWKFTYTLQAVNSRPEEIFEFDGRPVKEYLGDIPLSDPSVLAYLRGLFEEGIAQVSAAADLTRDMARSEKSM